MLTRSVISSVLLESPHLLQFVEPVHQTAELVEALIHILPYVIEHIREDLRTPKIIATCIAADPLCKNLLEPLPPKVIKGRESLYPTPFGEPQFYKDGVDVQFSQDTWQAAMWRTDLKDLRKALKKTPDFSKFLTHSALLGLVIMNIHEG